MATIAEEKGGTAAAAAPAEVTAQPLYRVRVEVFSDRLDVVPDAASPPIPISTGTMWGHRWTEVRPAAPHPPLKLIVPDSGEAQEAQLRSWGKKWLHRLGAALLWSVFGSELFLRAGVVTRLLSLSLGARGAEWATPTLLVLLVAVLVSAARVGTTRAAVASLYVVFFPVVAVFVVLARLFGAASLTQRAVTVVGSFIYQGANWTLIIAACLTIARTSWRWPVLASAVYLGGGALYLVVANFHWVTSPLSSIQRLADFFMPGLDRKVDQVDAELRQAIAAYRASPPDPARSDAVAKTVDEFQRTLSLLAAAQRALGVVSGRALLFYMFAARLLGSVALLQLIFSGLYLATAKLSHGSFSGAGIGSLLDAVYFSTVTFFTVGYGDIAPASALARVIVVAQILLGVVTLTVLAMSFSTISIDLAQQRAAAIAGRIGEFRQRANRMLLTHFRSSDASGLTDEDVKALKQDLRARLRSSS